VSVIQSVQYDYTGTLNGFPSIPEEMRVYQTF
jgi:hypothetical protein